MKSFFLERLSDEKLGAVAELEALVFAEPWSANSLCLLCEGNNVGFVATDDEGKVLGYGGMISVLDEGQITNIAVNPSCRRQRIGETIVLGLLDYGKENGISSVSLEVRESNAAAIALYEKLGFASVGVRKNFYSKPTENAIVMIKNIG